MAKITLNGRTYTIDLIALDKDGTLIDFNQMWSGLIDAWITRLVAHVDGSDALHEALNATLGYDPHTRSVIPDSPVAVATLAKISVAAMTVLYQHGIQWYAAETAVDHVNTETTFTPSPDLVKPIGDVAGAIERFGQASLHVVVVTSDDREMTVATLQHLGVAEKVDLLVCGDDPFPNKPAPDGLLHVSRTLGVPTSKMMMVGDSAGDMLFGRNAGVACCVGIAAGAGDAAALAAAADVVLGSIDEIL